MIGLLALNAISEIEKFFERELGDDLIKNYKVVLQLSMRIEVNVLLDNPRGVVWYFSQTPFLGLDKVIKINEIEYVNDPIHEKEYLLYFNKKIDLGLRRRLTNLIEYQDKQIRKPCPIVTFYSYKGGTGRTTTLSFFASWLATNFSKKVVIIDCDFEAPGLTNYFDISSEKKGIAEYFLDREFSKLKGEKLDIKKDYIHQVRYEYVGNGDIFVVPAGCLSNLVVPESDGRISRNDYLEAIARLDISNIRQIVQQFELFFDDLKEQLDLTSENSVILIDSRTGFNDTFAVLASLADLIVGFFGINKQSQIGLSHFLEEFGSLERGRDQQLILVNSISESLSHFQVFKDFINQYVQLNQQKFMDEQFGLKSFSSDIFRVPRTEFLGRIGTDLESSDKGVLEESNKSDDLLNIQFHTKVRRPDSEFEDLFNAIHSKISQVQYECKDEIEQISLHQQNEQMVEIKAVNVISESFFEEIRFKVDKVVVREQVLRNVIKEENFPKPYADTGIEKPMLRDFFFRDCMKDIFNRDKYVIIGYKGTGKTHIYRSFENSEITDRLCARENKSPSSFVFINVIPIKEHAHYFSTDDNFMQKEKSELGVDYFFKSFWLVYSWSSLFNHKKIQSLNIRPSLALFSIDESNIETILSIISDRESISKINYDLQKLNGKLESLDQYLILAYDQIDFVVKPNSWNDGVAPLINYWRTNPFSRIYPKVFVRADIFVDRLTNITNFNEIQKEKSISLQWSKQELFAYFFKYVFRISKSDFFALSYSYKDYTEHARKRLFQIEESLDVDDQIPVHREDLLKFLVESFFGKNADRYDRQKNGFGENYDWFYRNLTDAKNAISIRPFLDLIHKAVNIALEDSNLKSAKRYFYQQNQVLSAFYFTSNDAKAYAAERYYNDLAKDKGNEPLRLFYQYIKNDGLDRFRVYEFSREQLDDLLKRIIEFPNYKNEESLKEKSIDDFKNLLINNGVLTVVHVTNRQLTRYIIPFLYRSYFAVGNPDLFNRRRS